MKKIEMQTRGNKNFLAVFEMFIISQTAKGVADITIRNYRYHMKNMSHYFDAEKPFEEVTKRYIEAIPKIMVITLQSRLIAQQLT